MLHPVTSICFRTLFMFTSGIKQSLVSRNSGLIIDFNILSISLLQGEKSSCTDSSVGVITLGGNTSSKASAAVLITGGKIVAVVAQAHSSDADTACS